eukprot:gene21599-29649_t
MAVLRFVIRAGFSRDMAEQLLTDIQRSVQWFESLSGPMPQPQTPEHTFQHFLIGLLAIGNNISAIGAFLIQTRGLPRAQFGTAVLGFFGISISSFQIAGGILLGG